jgi:PAS domain S-box-containing protein
MLVESLNFVLFTLDDQGKITYVSDGCTESLGIHSEEMIGRPISAFVMPEDKGRVCETCEQAQQGKTGSSCFHVVGKEGCLHPAMAISRSVFDGQEKSGMIGMIGEIRYGKQTEKIILQANTKLHLLNSIARHDINNQLTLLQGYLYLMEQNDSEFKSPEIVRILLDATDKIHKIVTFTTEYKDIGSHAPMWMNLYEIFKSARSTMEVSGVQITPEPACRELELFCDPMLIKVFHHLIDNSHRHGKTVSEISLLWKRENGGAIIVYRDNGCGIPKTVRPTLFQQEKWKINEYSLFLVQEILAIYGFTITETGTPGKGVQFEIAVPAGSFRAGEKQQ